jgi:tripartite-type tricarboxylate transporter receptor subunit TctC
LVPSAGENSENQFNTWSVHAADCVVLSGVTRGTSMKLPRRQFLHLAAGAVGLLPVSRFAWAQAYPTRPVRMIVPFPAGGSTDVLARLMGQWLSVRLAQPFLVENRTGFTGNIGTEAVVHAPADGYTLLLATTTNVVNAAVYDKLNFNFTRDIVPVAGVMSTSHVMVVHPSVPARTIPEFIAYARANPAKISYASAGNGSNNHVTGEQFKMRTGVNMVHVPYRGGAPAVADLVGGQVQVMFAVMLEALEYIRDGTLQVIPPWSAVTGLLKSRVAAKFGGRHKPFGTVGGIK